MGASAPGYMVTLIGFMLHLESANLQGGFKVADVFGGYQSDGWVFQALTQNQGFPVQLRLVYSNLLILSFLCALISVSRGG